jgi:hypothetical protein
MMFLRFYSATKGHAPDGNNIQSIKVKDFPANALLG